MIIPLSGNMAFVGEDMRRAMLLAKEELSKPAFDYRLIFEDNALDLRKSALAAQKLINLDKVDALVSLWPPTANVVAPIAEANKIVHYTIAWDPAIAEKFHYTLSHQVMMNSYVKETLKLLRHIGVNTIALFQLNESGFNIGTDYLKNLSPEWGIKIVYETIFNPGQTDFKTEITKSKKHHPRAYLIWAVMPESALILRQLKELGVEAPVTGFFDVIQDLSLIEGAAFVSEISAERWFVDKFARRFGEPFALKAPNAYDIFNLLVMAHEKTPARKVKAQEIIKILTRVKDYPGAVGKVSIDPLGNSLYAASWKKVQNGMLHEIRDRP